MLLKLSVLNVRMAINLPLINVIMLSLIKEILIKLWVVFPMINQKLIASTVHQVLIKII
jgi:hypothetical protein